MPARTSSVVLVSSGLDSAVLLAHEATQYDARPVYVRSGLAWEQAELAMLSRLLTSPVYGGLGPLAVVDLPVTDVQGFIAYAKARPGQLAYASSGVGNPPHLAAELFRAMTGTEITHVPYGGDTPALVDIMAGRVQLYFGSVAPALPLRAAGKLRALAVSGATRSGAAPDLPTVAEAGLAGYNVSGWFGLLAPRGTPQPIIAQLNAMMIRIMAMEEVRATLLQGGADLADPSLPAMEQAIRDSVVLIGNAVRIAGIRAE